jgi:hypothetical protein
MTDASENNGKRIKKISFLMASEKERDLQILKILFAIIIKSTFLKIQRRAWKPYILITIIYGKMAMLAETELLKRSSDSINSLDIRKRFASISKNTIYANDAILEDINSIII